MTRDQRLGRASTPLGQQAVREPLGGRRGARASRNGAKRGCPRFAKINHDETESWHWCSNTQRDLAYDEASTMARKISCDCAVLPRPNNSFPEQIAPVVRYEYEDPRAGGIDDQHHKDEIIGMAKAQLRPAARDSRWRSGTRFAS